MKGRRLPPGANRVRASDRDREIACELLERHHNEGRLTTEELDERVARALRGKTLGALRKLLDDLPGDHTEPGTLVPARRAAPVRPRRRWGVVAGAVALVVAGVAVAGDQDAEERGEFLPPPPERITRVASGLEGRDGQFSFRFVEVGTVRELRPFRESDREGPVRAARGNELLVATVAVRNEGGRTEGPFCASGARLYVQDDQGFEPLDDLYRFDETGVLCGQGITPGEAARVELVFEVPEGARVRDLDLWDNREESDVLGATRVRMAPPPA